MCPVLTKSQFIFQNIDLDITNKKYNRLMKKKYFKKEIMNH